MNENLEILMPVSKKSFILINSSPNNPLLTNPAE